MRDVVEEQIEKRCEDNRLVAVTYEQQRGGMILHAMNTRKPGWKDTRLTQYRYEPKDITAYMGTMSKIRTMSEYMRGLLKVC